MCGVKKKSSNKPWFDGECRDKINVRKKAKETWLMNQTEDTRDSYLYEIRETTRMLRRKKREWVNNILEKAENDANGKNSREFYKAMKYFRKGFIPGAYGVKNRSGKVVIQEEESLDIWKEYFKELLNGEQREDDEEIECYQHVQPQVLQPSMEEVERAINDLKNNKAPGEDGVHGEFLKAGGAVIRKQLYGLITKIWTEEKTPDEWKEAIVVPIHKKGDKQDCKNYRGISLLNSSYKVMSRITLRRLEEYTKCIIGDHQAGFVRGKSTSDQVFIVKEALAKYWEFNRECYCMFIDFGKAYDSLNRNKLWSKMESFGIPKKLIKMTQISVERSCCKVKVNGKSSSVFEVNTGVRQGDSLSPILFNLGIEGALQKLRETDLGIKIGVKINVLAYADDVTILAESLEDLREMTRIMMQETEEMGLQVNDMKTKFMVCNRSRIIGPDVQEMNIEGHIFERVETFKYLGVMISSKDTEEKEIQNRIRNASRSLFACHKIMSSKILSKPTKIRIYKTIIRPVLLYNSENWILNKKSEKQLIVFENRVLRKIFGPVLENGEWRIRHNLELREVYKDPDVSAEVRSRRIRWAGHIMRREEGSLMKAVWRNTPEGRRPVGRPRNRWWDHVKKDIRRLGAEEAEAEDRILWRRHVEEAKYQLGYQTPRQ